MRLLRLSGLLLLACGCAGDEGEPKPIDMPSTSWDDLPELLKPNAELALLPKREEQYAKLCGLGRDDSFFRAICASQRPVISDMASLIQVAGLAENRAFALTGNSTSLVKTAVSAVNPRAIIFPRVAETRQKPAQLTALGFVRGEPFVEVVSRDTTSGEYNFYLFTFERPCDYDMGGCDLASLLTEEIERGWTAFSIYTEDDIENTSLDCRSCHQPGGVGTPKILRMQELENPWLHWFPQRFVQRTASDRLLTAQFLEAHRVDSAYAGIPIASIESGIEEGSGAQLEALLVAEGQDTQPNAFDPRIEAEARDGQASPTWEKQFAITLTGDAIGVPYPQADVTDPTLRAARVQSYVDVVSGAAPRESLLDLRELFSEDAKQKLGLVPPPGADGLTVLTQVCSRCHDGRGNPSLNKNAFNVKLLAQMSREEKDSVISRLKEPEGSLLRMPPWRAATLPPAALQSAIDELSK
ncbi:MAG TPA: hypothetical protein VJN18_03955 [Polyangiaceae bacterium]|nr:hypothetical protein [Polyangiaceae bacterium]